MAIAVYDLGLTREQFWDLTQSEFHDLCERWRLRGQREDYYSAHIISMLYNLQLDKKHRHKAKSALDFMMDKPTSEPRKQPTSTALIDQLDNFGGLNNAGEVTARELAGIHHVNIETVQGASGQSRILTDDLSALVVPVADESGLPNLHPLFTKVWQKQEQAQFWIDDRQTIMGKIKSISEPMTVDGVQVYQMTIEESD